MPNHIKSVMRSQGIKGPSYKFLHGNTKEILDMLMKSRGRPMDHLSHEIFPRIKPHVHSWVSLYGRNFLNWYGPQAQLVVTEAELIKEIMNNKDGVYPKIDLEGHAKKLLGNGLSSTKGDKWTKLRKIANGVFHGESLKDTFCLHLLLHQVDRRAEMDPMVKNLAVFSASFLSVYLIVMIVKFLHKVCWMPIRVQYALRSQGIKGPSYKFLHGNIKEISDMRKQSMGKPMDHLSHEIFPRLMPHVHSWVNLYGRNFLYWHGPQPQLVVTDAELIKEIMNNKDGAYPKLELGRYAKKLLGDGLSSTEGAKWVKLRKLANGVFHGERLKGMIPSMITSTETMLQRWKERKGEEIEVFEEFRLLTSEVISKTAFGSSYLEGQKIFDMMMKMAKIIARNMNIVQLPVISNMIKNKDDIASDKLEQGIKDCVVEIIRKKDQQDNVDTSISDYLGELIKASHDKDDLKRVFLDEMVDECRTFYFAGHETTTVLLGWTIFLLASHQEWQEKAREEVFEFFGQTIPDQDLITRLKIMNMILEESLRLYPPVILVKRRVAREVRLGNMKLPLNTELYISPLAVHHDPKIWGIDVHLFKPDRFEGGIAKATNNTPAAFIPFGFGPRICVGSNFAMAEAKIALAMILQRFKFKLSPNYVHSPIQVIMVKPQHGVQIILEAI